MSKRVGEFKAAIQTRNKNKLKSLSQYSPGREQFVNQLLSQYQNINVKISNLQLISKENKAQAQVELTDLVDINNKKVTPGSWSKFEIIVRHNSSKQLKVYWWLLIFVIIDKYQGSLFYIMQNVMMSTWWCDLSFNAIGR